MNRTIKGVDYSFGRPNLAELKRLGYRAVGRYLRGRGKALTKAEVADISRHGLSLWVCDETTAARSRDGHAAGEQDAREANAAAVAIGLKGIPIYMVDDANSTFEQVRPYFEGASGVLGKGRRGAYGSGKLLRQLMHAGLIDFAWEAGARSWGDGRRFEGAHILQDPSGHVASASVDVNHIAREAVASFRGGTLKPPKPRKYGSRPLKQGDQGQDVRQFQVYLTKVSAPFIALDGDYGPATEKAKHDAMWRLGWTDAQIKSHDRSKSIGKQGLGFIKKPASRPKTYKARQKQRAQKGAKK